jgi:FkbM family methyltransferase
MGMTATSFTSEFKQLITIVARSGVAEGARIVIRELGLHTYQSVVYPRLGRRFVVEFDPVWRWIEKDVREPGVLKFAEDMIGRGSTVFDVGAHVGEWTLLFSELVGPSGRVVAFEPDPVARASLKKNLEMNRISNVMVDEESVSDKTGKAVLRAERFGSGLSSIVRPHGRGTGYKELEVESTTLDEYCEKHGVSPDWIKIDAEGSEPLIVRGMQGLIANRHPQVILEFHSDALTDEEKREAWSTVTERASNIEFLQSRLRNHVYLESLSKGYVPDCGFLVIHVSY